MYAVLGFLGLVFVLALRRPDVSSPRLATIALLAVVVATALLSHRVA